MKTITLSKERRPMTAALYDAIFDAAQTGALAVADTLATMLLIVKARVAEIRAARAKTPTSNATSVTVKAAVFAADKDLAKRYTESSGSEK